MDIDAQNQIIQSAVTGMNTVVTATKMAYPHRSKEAIRQTCILYLDHVLKDMPEESLWQEERKRDDNAG